MVAVCGLAAVVVLCALLALRLVRLALALWWWCPWCWEEVPEKPKRR